MDTNTVILSGRLTADPTKREAGETVATSTSLAFSRYKKKGEGFEEITSFFPLTAIGYTAQKLIDKGKKGSKVNVTGRLEQRRWVSSEGQKREVTEVVVSDVQFLDKVKGSGTSQTAEDSPF